MLATDLSLNTHDSVDWFEHGSADIRIAILHSIAQRLYKNAAPPAAFFSQVVQQLIRQVEYVPQDQKADVLKEMVSGANTRLAVAYDDLDVNLQLAFWYRLANTTPLMAHTISRLETAHHLTLETRLTLEAHFRDIVKRDVNELMEIFKTAVSMTGKAAHQLA